MLSTRTTVIVITCECPALKRTDLGSFYSSGPWAQENTGSVQVIKPFGK